MPDAARASPRPLGCPTASPAFELPPGRPDRPRWTWLHGGGRWLCAAPRRTRRRGGLLPSAPALRRSSDGPPRLLRRSPEAPARKPTIALRLRLNDEASPGGFGSLFAIARRAAGRRRGAAHGLASAWCSNDSPTSRSLASSWTACPSQECARHHRHGGRLSPWAAKRAWRAIGRAADQVRTVGSVYAAGDGREFVGLRSTGTRGPNRHQWSPAGAGHRVRWRADPSRPGR